MNYEVVVQQYLYFLLWSFLIHCRLVSCSCGWCSALSLTWSWSLCCFRWYFILASLCVSFCPCIKMLLITDWSSRCDAVFRWFYDAPKFFVLSTEAVSVAIYQVFTHLLIRIFYEFADDFFTLPLFWFWQIFPFVVTFQPTLLWVPLGRLCMCGFSSDWGWVCDWVWNFHEKLSSLKTSSICSGKHFSTGLALSTI